MVEDSKSLEFDWSLSGTRQPDGSLRFLLDLPPCTISQVWLDIPEGHAVHTDHVLVSRTTADDHRLPTFGLGVADPPISTDHGEPTADKWSRWLIDLGGKPTAKLDIVPQALREDLRPVVLYRRESTFFLSERGLELSSDLKLQGQLSRQVVLELGAGLELTVAK